MTLEMAARIFSPSLRSSLARSHLGVPTVIWALKSAPISWKVMLSVQMVTFPEKNFAYVAAICHTSTSEGRTKRTVPVLPFLFLRSLAQV